MMDRRTATALTAVTLLVAACTGAPADEPAPSGGDDGAAATDAADAATEEAVVPSGRLRLTGFAEHQRGGLSVALRSVEVTDEGHVLVEVEAVNSGTGTRRLSGLSTLLEDDLGNRYRFVPPPDDTSLTLRSDQRLTGTLAFEGPVDPDARRLILGFNQRSDTPGAEVVSAQDRPATDQYPPMAFRDVPLPGVGLEDEATIEGPGSLLDPVTVEVGETASPEAAPDVDVTVVGYTTDGRTLELELEVVNGSSQRIRMLAQQPVLTDDLGTRFHFRRGEGDDAEARLELQPGEEATATLGFRATIVPTASELRLTLNGFGLQEGSERSPGLRFTLPVPEDLHGEDDQ